MPSLSSEERQLLDDSLQSFLIANYGFERWRKLARAPETEGFGRAEWAKFAELGWLGVAMPEEAGGAGGGMTELGIVMAGAGRNLVLEPLLGTIVLGAAAIEMAGSAAQRETLLPPIAAGETLMAFCHAEPGGGYARNHVRAIARRDGGGYVIDGEKSFALGAHAADTLVVSARIGADNRPNGGPVGLFLLPRTAPGVRLAVAPALDGRLGAAVHLSGVKVGATAKLGDGDEDQLGVIDRLLDRGAIAVCAEACGAMAAVTQATVDYLKTRQQFGQPLAKFQVLQHRLVDMSVAGEEARAVVHAALQALDDEKERGTGAPAAQRAVWIAKVQTARSARFVGGQAIQLHGGMGMTDELAIGHYYKRLTLCETLFGDGEWYLKQLGATAAAANSRI
jgi:alkylation response protein AidB-like acyl-CoA dehydrogenase